LNLFFYFIKKQTLRKTMKTPITCAVLAGSVLLISQSGAATTFENSLKGIGANGNNGGQANSSEDSATVTNTNNAGLETAFIWGGGDGSPDPGGHASFERIEFSSTGATFGAGQGGDAGRNYLRTVAKDYYTTDFTAEVLFTTNASNGGQALFIGMGAGERGDTFGFPDISSSTDYSSVFLEARDGGNQVATYAFSEMTGESPEARLGNALDATYSDSFSWSAGTHRAIMSFDVSAQEMIFQLDLGNDDSIDGVSMVVNVSALMDDWAGGDAAVLFIGGDDGIVLSDLKVNAVPEPGTYALLAGCFALASVLFRRRRA
jgi:hypothetical protein